MRAKGLTLLLFVDRRPVSLPWAPEPNSLAVCFGGHIGPVDCRLRTALPGDRQVLAAARRRVADAVHIDDKRTGFSRPDAAFGNGSRDISGLHVVHPSAPCHAPPAAHALPP